MIFFTADHHFDHFNIIRYCGRPFSGVNEMNEELVRRWNSVVSPGDTVYYLGDFSMAKRPVGFIGMQLNGEKHLVAGNHDHWKPGRQNRVEVEEAYLHAGFKSFQTEMNMRIADREVLLNHFPYRSAEDSAKYKIKHPERRPEDRGLWLIHGHVHEKWRVKGRMINVGVDAWEFRPVSISVIEDLIRQNEPGKGSFGSGGDDHGAM